MAGIAVAVKPITLSERGLIILEAMLLLAAIHRIWTPRETQANDLLAAPRAALGHLGLTVIALVFVLLTFWKS